MRDQNNLVHPAKQTSRNHMVEDLIMTGAQNIIGWNIPLVKTKFAVIFVDTFPRHSKVKKVPLFRMALTAGKKCTGDSHKNNRLLRHKKSEQHVNSAARYAAYKEAKQMKSTLANLLNEQHKETVKENREFIKTIADILRLTAVQNIAQRGLERQMPRIIKGIS